MSTWHLPTAVTLTVVLYIPSFHILASVDSNWQHIVGCADRYVIECFLGSNFDVRCLGDLFANESVMKYRLDRLCHARLGEPSEAIPPAVLFGSRHNCISVCFAAGTVHRCEICWNGASVTRPFPRMASKGCFRSGV